MIDLDKLEALAMNTTVGPWHWKDSGILVGDYDGSDGDLVLGASTAKNGAPFVYVHPTDGAYIEAVDPTTILELIKLARGGG